MRQKLKKKRSVFDGLELMYFHLTPIIAKLLLPPT